MGGGSGSTSSTAIPWKEAVPYLTGAPNAVTGEKKPGIFNEAANLYTKSGWTPDMEYGKQVYSDLFPDRLAGTKVMEQKAGQISKGAYDTQPEKAANVGHYQVDASARQGQGVLDPTKALSKLLTGQVQNQHLDPLAESITNRITRNTTEEVLPAIRSEAMAAGGYGSSRQGLAEGKAISRLNQDLSTGLAPVYAQAFENAQNRMAGTASELNLQAERVATANADRALNADQFNSNLTLQGNAQSLQANQANLQNQLRASDLYGQALNFQDVGFEQYQNLLKLPQNQQAEALARYAGIIQPGAGLGGAASQTAKQGRSPIAGAAGGALSGAMAGAMAGSVIPGVGTAVGALAGAVLGGVGGGLSAS